MSTANPRKQPASLRIILTGFLVLWVIMAAFPFLWTLWGSFKVEGDFFSKANWVYALTGESTRVETGGSRDLDVRKPCYPAQSRYAAQPGGGQSVLAWSLS